MSNIVLKPYYYKIHAVKITRANYQALKKLDQGDGVLYEGSFEDFEGDWFIKEADGYKVMPGNETLIPVKGGG